MKQHGNLTRKQLLELGWTKDGIRAGVRSGHLHRVHQGVYALGRPATTAHERAMAAVLAGGEGALLAGAAALALWELGDWPSRMELICARELRLPGLVTHRVRTLRRRDARRHQGIRVTSPARTLLDVAPGLSERRLTRTVNDALRAKRVRREHIAELLTRLPTHPGARRLRPHAGDLTGPTRSTMEDDFRRFCRRYRLPEAEINVQVDGYEVDAFYRAEGVIVELDGWGFHNDRSAFESDRERDAHALVHGNITVRITERRMHGQPGLEADRLQAILQQRRRSPRAA